MRYEAKIKPKKCPKCDSNRIARIQYGLPIDSEKLWKDINEGRIVLGGCVIHGDDPSWQCMECKVQIFRDIKANDLQSGMR